MGNYIDITGEKFGKLTALVKLKRKTKAAYWECLCECGDTTITRGIALRHGSIRSCGCLRGRSGVGKGDKGSLGWKGNHGLSHTYTYYSWTAMRYRCNNKRFIYYHGRGVMYDKRWDGYPNFLQDMGVRPKGKTLDRINGNWHYTPDNCRWATPK